MVELRRGYIWNRSTAIGVPVSVTPVFYLNTDVNTWALGSYIIDLLQISRWLNVEEDTFGTRVTAMGVLVTPALYLNTTVSIWALGIDVLEISLLPFPSLDGVGILNEV